MKADKTACGVCCLQMSCSGLCGRLVCSATARQTMYALKWTSTAGSTPSSTAAMQQWRKLWQGLHSTVSGRVLMIAPRFMHIRRQHNDLQWTRCSTATTGIRHGWTSSRKIFFSLSDSHRFCTYWHPGTSAAHVLHPCPLSSMQAIPSWTTFLFPWQPAPPASAAPSPVSPPAASL